jgi:hypothetical protein
MGDTTEKNTQTWSLVLPVGCLTLLGALVLNVNSNATRALDLAVQNGENFTLLKKETSLLRQDLKDKTRDRYTNRDAERDLDYIKRDIAELKAVVKEAHSGRTD